MNSSPDSSPLLRKIREKLNSPGSKRGSGSNFISLQRAFTNSPDQNDTNACDEVLMDRERLLKNKRAQFEMNENEENLRKVAKGLEILAKLRKKPHQNLNTTSQEVIKSTRTINLNNSRSENQISLPEDSELEEGSLRVRSNSDGEDEEKKSNRNSPKKHKTSINLIPEQKASIFRKNNELRVNTVLDFQNVMGSVIMKQQSFANRRALTVLNIEDSPGQTKSSLKSKKPQNMSKLLKKSANKVNRIANLKKNLEPTTFMGASFKESEVKNARPYHNKVLEVNNPKLIKEKNFMQKGFSNDLTMNKATFFSKKLKEKMNRQVRNDEEEELLERRQGGWMQCDFSAKNSCKCVIF